jgi:RNA polymerase sigma-70 factor (ECF subfamily)
MLDDPTDFVRLYGQHYRELYRHAIMLVVRAADADDVMQEASIVLWRKFAEYDPARPFLPWAKRVIYFEAQKLRERLRRIPGQLSETVLAQLAAVDPSDDEMLATQERALSDCVEKLRPQDRELLEQRYAGTQSVREFAAASGMSEGALYVMLSRIRQRLIDCTSRALAKEGFA